ncbi:Uncharacterised protein [Mycobacteroides abscessus subsp. abscessus]|nr:Uncharacterised protein [Mycobacteroides abscessus subsp. abscessus]
MRSGRGRAVSASLPVPACCSTRTASAATVGASNSNRTGTRVLSAAPSREATCVASSELPPQAKKSSSRPIRAPPALWSRPSTSAKVVATICSIGVVGARNTAFSKVGSGSALRSSLPLTFSGSSSSCMNTDGTM